MKFYCSLHDESKQVTGGKNELHIMRYLIPFVDSIWHTIKQINDKSLCVTKVRVCRDVGSLRHMIIIEGQSQHFRQVDAAWLGELELGIRRKWK